MSSKRKVCKVEQGTGKILATYNSVTEAANVNHLSRTSVKRRCMNLVKNPYSLLGGCTFQYSAKVCKHRKVVCKVTGLSHHVVATYPNIAEAARANNIDWGCVKARCENQVKYPCGLVSGYTFQYEDDLKE